MSLIGRVFDPRDRSVELHDVAGVAIILTLIGLALYQAVVDIHAVSLVAFGGGASAIIAAMSGAGWMRAKAQLSDPPPQGEQPPCGN